MQPSHPSGADDLCETDVLEALRVCFDPELAVNVVDLGLIESIFLEQDQEAPGFLPRYRVRVMLLRRTGSDERLAMLHAQIENRLMGLPRITQAEVNTSAETLWNADRMNPAARRQLRLDRAQLPGLIQIKL